MSYTRRTYSGFVPLVGTTDGYTCGQVNQFIVIAPSSNPYSVQWSAIGDPTSFPTPNTDAARAVQAGQQILSNEFGIVTGVAGNDFFGLAFQERAITKMTYSGGDVVFSFDTFEEGRGCFELNRFVAVDDAVFFESERGYHAVENGIVVNIGVDSVDDTYPPIRESSFTNSNGVAAASVASNMDRNLVFFESQNLCYNYVTQQWTRLPALDGRGYYSLHDKADLVGQSVIVSESAYSQTSSGGTPQAVTVTTGDNDTNQGGRTFLGGVRPLTDGGTWAVRVGSRDTLSTTPSFSTSTSVTDRTGFADFREEGRYQRVELTNSDGFNTLMGVDIDFEPAGEV